MNTMSDSSSKIGHDFRKKVFQKLKVLKNDFNKNCASKLVLFPIEKPIRRIGF